jgi:hypothetical protein
MSIMIVPSIDGDGRTRLQRAQAMMRSQETTDQISMEANRRFQESNPVVEPGDLVCTVHFGVADHRQYKVFEVKETTVVIALPDMEMKEVPKASLYHADVCIDIIWEKVDADLRN